jgi:hypothetical protein
LQQLVAEVVVANNQTGYLQPPTCMRNGLNIHQTESLIFTIVFSVSFSVDPSFGSGGTASVSTSR